MFLFNSISRLVYGFFSRVYVQSNRDSRSPGKDSLFNRLKSRVPFIIIVLTVYVIFFR